jgi:hypothetical protein
MPPASAYQPQESRRAPDVADLLPLGVLLVIDSPHVLTDAFA